MHNLIENSASFFYASLYTNFHLLVFSAFCYSFSYAWTKNQSHNNTMHANNVFLRSMPSLLFIFIYLIVTDYSSNVPLRMQINAIVAQKLYLFFTRLNWFDFELKSLHRVYYF